MPNYRIHIEGKVQGVGFRPFIYRLATRMQLTGWVANERDGVHIVVTGDEDKIRVFSELISIESRPFAYITSKVIQITDEGQLNGFIIKENHSNAFVRQLIAPDIALCEFCRNEIEDKSSTRFQYAFNSCVSCGPRYSIISNFPYERVHTTMKDMIMCYSCQQEYFSVEDRRFYSQTNSCSICAIEMKLYDANRNQIVLKQQEIVKYLVYLLREGKILAVKGLGGYLLLVDARNAEAIIRLRKRKNRIAKPFAVMYPSLSYAKMDVLLKKEECEALCGKESPVVVVPVRGFCKSGIRKDLVAPGLNKLGVLLPYTAFFELILSEFKSPVIATSANISGGGIVYQDANAFEDLRGIADFVLSNNRGIVVPQDDSVIQFSERHRKIIILRRSRGYAPSFYTMAVSNWNNMNALAMGSDLKSTFSFAIDTNVYVSQYLGNLSSFDCQLNYNNTLEHLSNILDFTPSAILVDKHPDYFSKGMGIELSEKLSIPLIEVQHHEAHFAAVLAENNLLEQSESIIGIIWDGMGFGNDGHIYGGEFLLYKNFQIKKLAQMEAFPHILGDKMQTEPRISALSMTHRIEGAKEILTHKFTKTEWEIYSSLLKEECMLQCTSVGRLFDAVASLLGISDKTSYEAEGALLLEELAKKYPEVMRVESYQLGTINSNTIPLFDILSQIVEDIQSGCALELIAARFHVTMVVLIEKVASYYSIKRLAFSGGVFQNSLLIDLVIDKFGKDYELYFHQQLSPNDECISFGQLAWMYLYNEELKESVKLPRKDIN